MEGQIRKRRQQEIYDKKIFREKVIGVVAVFVLRGLGYSWSFSTPSWAGRGVVRLKNVYVTGRSRDV